jgi:uncharacterized protein YecT (DUF1311 family)
VIRITLSVALLTFTALAARANSDLCENATSTVDIVECADKERGQWDDRLNAAYKSLASKLDEQQVAELRDIQRKWIGYCDAVCPFEVETGTMRQIVIAGCFIDMTRTRAIEIEGLLERVDE